MNTYLNHEPTLVTGVYPDNTQSVLTHFMYDSIVATQAGFSKTALADKH